MMRHIAKHKGILDPQIRMIFLSFSKQGLTPAPALFSVLVFLCAGHRRNPLEETGQKMLHLMLAGVGIIPVFFDSRTCEF